MSVAGVSDHHGSLARLHRHAPPACRILWAMGLGETSLDNKYYLFRKSYSNLYHHMMPGKVRRCAHLQPGRPGSATAEQVGISARLLWGPSEA